MLKSLFAASCFLALFGAASMAEDLTNKLGLYHAAGMLPAAVVAAQWEHSRPVLISTEQPTVGSGTSYSPTITVPSDATLVVISIGVLGPTANSNVDYTNGTPILNGLAAEDYGSVTSTGNIKGYLGAIISAWPTSATGTGAMTLTLSSTTSVTVWSVFVYYFKNATGITIDGVNNFYWPGFQSLSHARITAPNPIKCLARPMSRFPFFVGIAGRDASIASGTWAPGNQTQIGFSQGW